MDTSAWGRAWLAASCVVAMGCSQDAPATAASAVSTLPVVSSTVPSAAPRARALVVGVGQYRSSTITSLPGIDVDVATMRTMLDGMGIAERDILVLEDSAATKAKVVDAFRSHLIDGTKPGDKVVFYFSGHGSSMPDESGDEDDNADEFLVMHDTALSGSSVSNALVDDEISELLSELSGREVLVLVDACHSGTVTKGMNLAATLFPTSAPTAVVPKIWNHRLSGRTAKVQGVIDPQSGFGDPEAPGAKVEYVALMAAQDDQTADATNDGSVFTLGLHAAFRSARMSGKSLTASGVRDEVATFVRQAGSSFSPNALSEPTDLVDKRVIFDSPARGEAGPYWQKLEQLVSGSATEVKIESAKSEYRTGDKLSVELTMPAEGYVYLLAVSEVDDKVDVLYPSSWSGSNRYGEGESVRIPDNDRWKRQWQIPVVAGKGDGRNMIVAIVSQSELNLRASGTGGTEKLFVGLSPKGMASLRSAFEASAGGARYPMAGQVVVTVQP